MHVQAYLKKWSILGKYWVPSLSWHQCTCVVVTVNMSSVWRAGPCFFYRVMVVQMLLKHCWTVSMY